MLKTKKIAWTATALFTFLILFVSSAHAKVEYGIGYGGNRDYVGGDYANFKVKDLDECLRICATDKRCKVFAYADSAKACTLKEYVGKQVRSPGMIAGEKL